MPCELLGKVGDPHIALQMSNGLVQGMVSHTSTRAVHPAWHAIPCAGKAAGDARGSSGKGGRRDHAGGHKPHWAARGGWACRWHHPDMEHRHRRLRGQADLACFNESITSYVETITARYAVCMLQRHVFTISQLAPWAGLLSSELH